MSRSARFLCQLLVTAVIAWVVSFTIPVLVDRRDYTSAVVKASKNPSRENLALLDSERARNQQSAFKAHLAAATMIFVLLNGGYLLVRRFK